ncbi:MAG: enhanced entry protein [uncultured bacterium]|nr:MAG: enhanced entry protein [uncultured bacterium]
MNRIPVRVLILTFGAFSFLLSSCASQFGDNDSYNQTASNDQLPPYQRVHDYTNYAERLPQQIDTNGKKVVVIDPSAHAWGAYDSDGNLIRAGIATAGGDWCEDTGRPCRTSVGKFKIRSLGGSECFSSKYPLPDGGGLMPYCMFFNGDQALHGSPDLAVVEDNISHGCVRMRIPDAEWLRFNFAQIGTPVIVKSY